VKRGMKGPLFISLLLHCLLILAFILKWNLDKPKRPAGGGGGVVHAVVIDQLEFKQHTEFVKQQKEEAKQAEQQKQEAERAAQEAQRQQKEAETLHLRGRGEKGQT